MKNYLERQFGLTGKRALVTGGGRGIGRAVSLALAAVGAEVAVHYNKNRAAAEKAAEEITKGGGRAWVPSAADLSNAASTGKLFAEVEKRWNALDILVNNAGDLGGRVKLEDAADEMMDHIIRSNLYSTLFATRAAVPLLRRGKTPVVINMSSVSAHNGGLGGVSIYAASKGGILTLTRSLAKELAPEIRVNGLAPGVIITDLQRTHTSEENLRKTEVTTPLKRNGEAEECAPAVVFLCSQASSFITGEVIEINGGLWVA